MARRVTPTNELTGLALVWLALAALGGWWLWSSGGGSLSAHPCDHHAHASDQALTHYATTGCAHCGAHFG